MAAWQVLIDFESDTKLSEEMAFDVSERLGEHGAVPSFELGGTQGSIVMCVDAEDVIEAARQGLEYTGQALPDCKLTPNNLEVTEWGKAVVHLHDPLYPEVVGYAEIARLAGVTRQRARMFPKIVDFPKPVIETAQGALYTKSAIEAWLERRTRKAKKA